jgi:hypothetical protein
LAVLPQGGLPGAWMRNGGARLGEEGVIPAADKEPNKHEWDPFREAANWKREWYPIETRIVYCKIGFGRGGLLKWRRVAESTRNSPSATTASRALFPRRISIGDRLPVELKAIIGACGRCS